MIDPSPLLRSVSTGLLAGCGLIAITALLFCLKYYRDLRQATFFILRQRTRRKLRNSILLAAIFALVAAGTLYVRHGWPAPEEETGNPVIPTAASLESVQASSPRPTAQAAQPEATATPTPASFQEASATAPYIPTNTTTPSPSVTPTPSQTPSITPTPTNSLTPSPTVPILEAIYTPVTPYATLRPEAFVDELTISRGIYLDGTPINPGTSFPAGRPVLFVSFSYANLSNGLIWRHVWLRNGQLFDGATRIWEWGWRGRTYFYLRPLGGFPAGEYTVQFLVDERVVQTADFRVTEP